LALIIDYDLFIIRKGNQRFTRQSLTITCIGPITRAQIIRCVIRGTFTQGTVCRELYILEEYLAKPLNENPLWRRWDSAICT